MLAGCFLFSHEMPKTWNKKKDIDKQHRKKKEENKHLLCWCSLCLYNADDLLWFSLHHRRHCLSHKQQFKEKTNVHSSMSISIIFKFIFAWSSWAGHPHLSPRCDSLSLINKCAILMDKIAAKKKEINFVVMIENSSVHGRFLLFKYKLFAYSSTKKWNILFTFSLNTMKRIRKCSIWSV